MTVFMPFPQMQNVAGKMLGGLGRVGYLTAREFYEGVVGGLYSFTGGPVAVPDMNGILRAGAADQPSVEGGRWATTVAEGAIQVGEDIIPQWVPTVGPELVTNGNFSDGTTGWSLGAGWSVANGKATHTGALGYITQTAPLISGKTYIAQIYADSTGDARIGVSAHSGTRIGATSTTIAGLYSVVFTSNGTDFKVFSGGEAVIDYISVREVPPNYAPWKVDSEGNPDYTTDDNTSIFPYELVRGKQRYTDYEYKYFAARTNLCLQSSSLNVAPWAKDGMIVTEDAATAPDNTTSAGRITPTAYGQMFAIYDMSNTTWIAQDIPYADYGGISTDKYNRIEYPFTTPAGCTSVGVYTNRETTGASWQRQVVTVEAETEYVWSFWIKDGTTYFDVCKAQLETGSEASWNIETTDATVTEPAGVYSRLNPLAFKRTALWGASTNKVTCRKANPTDTTNITKISGDDNTVVSVVSETEANLRDAIDEKGKSVDLTKICTSLKVYKFDNTAGVVDTLYEFVGEVANANAHSGAMYVRDESDNSTLMYIGYTSSGFIYNTSRKYNRLILEDITNSSTTVGLRVKILAGKVAYVILPQLEESPYCTPPIFKASDGTDPLTALTRPATRLVEQSAGVLRGNNLALMGQVIPGGEGQTGMYMLSAYADANNECSLVMYASTIGLVKKVAGNTLGFFTCSYTHKKDVPFQYQAYLSSTYGMGIRVRYWLGMAWSAWTDWATNANTQDAPIASTFEQGSRNDANRFVGNYQMFLPIWHNDPKTYLENMEQAA